ncbi:hypothetical protein KIW84_012364 [Lathyrus oleraceus]|uniref:Ribosomal protein L16 n=1 Tax=Pisum sativum TaxID=3888 RepID=A0A9D5BHH6_PEA|nr:hypothetical protein KIW84_012364 [Pisum sativum]
MLTLIALNIILSLGIAGNIISMKTMGQGSGYLVKPAPVFNLGIKYLKKILPEKLERVEQKSFQSQNKEALRRIKTRDFEKGLIRKDVRQHDPRKKRLSSIPWEPEFKRESSMQLHTCQSEGAEIASTECGKYGKTSRNVFNQKIDYASPEVSTRYGISARRAIIGHFHRAMSRQFRKNGKIWVRVFADIPITGKPTEAYDPDTLRVFSGTLSSDCIRYSLYDHKVVWCLGRSSLLAFGRDREARRSRDIADQCTPHLVEREGNAAPAAI